MIQCCVCEDWFHEEHLGKELQIPRDEDGEPLYEDLICHMCSPICSFLHLYPQTIYASHKQLNTATASKDKGVEAAPSGSGSSAMPENGISEVHNADETVLDPNLKSMDDDKNMLVGEKSDKCILGVDILTTELTLEKCQPMFLSKNWREALCGCEKCLGFYAEKGISFLLDEEDSIAEYEKVAKQRRDE